MSKGHRFSRASLAVWVAGTALVILPLAAALAAPTQPGHERANPQPVAVAWTAGDPGTLSGEESRRGGSPDRPAIRRGRVVG